ncbi:hypothetical protein JL721_2273 [Aureococcus anophagefferens]|nr:hypothetical protein JL721_2273 [Aureococcus anophagefferens]
MKKREAIAEVAEKIGLPPRESVKEPERALLSRLSAKAPAATPDKPRGPCDSCDGPHATRDCPYFKGKPRDDHKDAFVNYNKGEAGGGDDAKPTIVDRGRATVVKQPGDGSCLYHSLTFGLGSGSAATLRAALADLVVTNPDQEIGGDPLRAWVLWESGLSPKAYADRMRSDGQWGGAIEMALCAVMKRVHIHVYEKHTRGFLRISSFTGGDRCQKVVSVIYNFPTMSNFAKFRERFSSSSKKKEEPSSETPAASAKFADDAKAAMGRVERYAALGRRMAARADPPGWDDVGDGSSKPLAAGGGNLRCIKLPVCDLAGTPPYAAACGYPLAKAQSLCERLALLLGPLVDAELASRDATAKKAKGVSPEGARQLREVLEREIAAANSSARLHEVANQVEEVRAIMEKNVEMILDRGEQLESLDAKSEDLSTATGMFRKQARKLKRWHLMNQVKYGLAVGTIVTASVAVPIAILVAA